MATIPTAINAGGGTVWLLPLDTVSEADLLMRASLTAGDREAFDLFAPGQQQRRKEWLAGRVLVREHLGGRIGHEPCGRPVLLTSGGTPDGKRHISISHTAGWAALMAADRPCGLDIELAERSADRVASRISAPGEIDIAATLYPKNPALLVWCAKESAYKALGHEGMDFREHIRITGSAAAQTLLITVGTGCMALEFFTLKDLIGVCCTI